MRPFDQVYQERLTQWAARNRERFWSRFWDSAGISARHRAAVCRPIDHRDGLLDPAIDAVIGFCRRERLVGGLYLSGSVGCGKTLLAAKALHLLARDEADNIARSLGWLYADQSKPLDVQIVTVPDLLAQIRATFDQTGASAREIVNDLRFRWFLVLDDIGAESPTDWVRDTLFQIIDWRYGYNLPTIFTSNCALPALAKRVGERIADRILEMCGNRIIEIPCGSYRGKT